MGTINRDKSQHSADWIIIVAGGKGKRMGLQQPKQFCEFQGKAILQHTIERAKNNNLDAKILLVLPIDYHNYWLSYCQKKGYTVDYTLIVGGEERYFSVHNALQTLTGENGIVAIHDGVRPLVTEKIWKKGIAIAREKGVAIPVLAVKETLVQECSDKIMPVNRAQYKIVQTPQFFDLSILQKAYFNQDYCAAFTDDSSVAYHAGYCIHTFEGEEKNIKLTTIADFELLESWVESKEFAL